MKGLHIRIWLTRKKTKEKNSWKTIIEQGSWIVWLGWKKSENWACLIFRFCKYYNNWGSVV